MPLFPSLKYSQNKDKNYKQVRHFYASVASNPQMRYSLECIRLNLVIALIGWLGTDEYI